ncbi:MAG TPA: protein kinase [Gemmatimonadaceae bacterium]|nr:protein kinase [Gemmatimonadaceae bacterium]
MTFPAAAESMLAERYAIERELGQGGMAVVYLAEERKHRRKVALKALRPEFAASLGAERFLREIAIAARLAHPHILPLIDSGDANGLLYYVTPFIPGGSLRERLENAGRISLRDAVRITEGVGAGLEFAHRAGFVHRDVKPENILFSDDHPVLADFGLARAFCAIEPTVLTGALSEIGMALGTPSYMSPEQAAGELNLSPRSDIYSLGCVVYEMLAGQPPFHGTGARAVMARHVTEPPRPLRTLRAEIPGAVEAAVAKALAKDPEHRHPSVAAFVGELAAALHAAPRSYLAPTAPRSIAVLPFVNASGDPGNEYLSDGITDELIDALAKVEGLRVASRTSVFALKGKPQDVRAIGALIGATVVLEGTLRRSGDRLRVTAQLTSTDDGRLLWSQRYDRRLDDVFTVQDELARTIVTTLRGTTLGAAAEAPAKRHTESAKAYGLYLRGRWAANKRSQEGIAEAIGYFEQALGEDPRYSLALTGLADAYALHVDYRSVRVHEGFENARRYARAALDLDDSLAEAHASLAWTLFVHDWNWTEAEHEFRQAIELDPRYAPAHQWFAFLLVSQARHEEALVEGHTALELDPGSVSVRRSLGWLYYYARRFERARHHLERAVEMNPMAEETYRVLGLTTAVEGRYEQAERTLREALALPGAGTYTLATLGYALARGGHRAEAEEIVRQLRLRAAQEYVAPPAMSTAHIGLGDVPSALDWLEKAYEGRRGWPVYLRVNPVFDPLRGEPRFEALVERMRFPPG